MAIITTIAIVNNVAILFIIIIVFLVIWFAKLIKNLNCLQLLRLIYDEGDIFFWKVFGFILRMGLFGRCEYAISPRMIQ